MAAGFFRARCCPKPIICEYKTSRTVSVSDCKDLILPAQPAGGAHNLFGFIAKIQIEHPIFPALLRLGVPCPTWQRQ